jgi:hypothetical protein
MVDLTTAEILYFIFSVALTEVTKLHLPLTSRIFYFILINLLGEGVVVLI